MKEQKQEDRRKFIREDSEEIGRDEDMKEDSGGRGRAGNEGVRRCGNQVSIPVTFECVWRRGSVLVEAHLAECGSLQGDNT